MVDTEALVAELDRREESAAARSTVTDPTPLPPDHRSGVSRGADLAARRRGQLGVLARARTAVLD